ncbi:MULTISPECIES: hypothetical protein [unclassified Mycobacterium]|nr:MULTISPECIES: hypothetical protein [unclassified Mycobacterium]
MSVARGLGESVSNLPGSSLVPPPSFLGTPQMGAALSVLEYGKAHP